MNDLINGMVAELPAVKSDVLMGITSLIVIGVVILGFRTLRNMMLERSPSDTDEGGS
jgi:hypothetical protein